MSYRLRMLKYNLERRIFYSLYKAERLIFDHVPKCAGSSVIHSLKRVYSPSVTYGLDGVHYNESIEKFKSFAPEEQLKYKFIYGHNSNQIVEEFAEDRKLVTVLREPIDRMISHYYYVKSLKSHFLHKELIERRISLADYCHSGLSNELENQYTQHFSKMSLEEIYNNPSAAVDLAFKNLLEQYDVIGFQSNLQGFLNAVSQLLSVPTSLFQVEKVNVTSKKPKKIDESAIEAIRQKNELDILLYDRLLQYSDHEVIIRKSSK